MPTKKKLIHQGLHGDVEYDFQIVVEELPIGYKGKRVKWRVYHSSGSDRRMNEFSSKKEAIKFANSDQCIPHAWGDCINISWEPIRSES